MKLYFAIPKESSFNQPPSGGCVLKQYISFVILKIDLPAAFRRLCVETSDDLKKSVKDKPAAFRRLCVETRLKTF